MRNKTFIRCIAIISLVAFLAISIIVAIPSFHVSAETAQEKIDNSIKKQNEIKEQIKSAEQKKNDNLAKKKVVDDEINSLQSKIDGISAEISTSNTKIAEKEQELLEAQENSKNQYASYCSRAKTLIEKGSLTYLEILLKSESFSDFLTRLSIVKQIAKYDNNKLNELKAVEEKIVSVKKELEDEKDNLVSLKKENDGHMSTLKTKQAESQSIINGITADIEQYKAALAAQEKAEAAAREEIRRLTEPTAASTTFVGGTFAWPSVTSYITSPYGTRVHPVTKTVKTHSGVDIGAGMGTNIFAAADGKVIVSGWNSGGYGNYVVIDHGGGVTTLYAHCSSLLVSSGQSVTKGQVIAKVGSTGMSTGPHLHFEVLKNGSHTNPMAYFN